MGEDHLSDTLEAAGAVPNALLELLLSTVDQIVADVPFPRISRALCRERHGQTRYLGLGALRIPSEALDHFAVGIARVELHPYVRARRIVAQRGFDGARPLKEGLPVDLREQSKDANGS